MGSLMFKKRRIPVKKRRLISYGNEYLNDKP
jgi:hypothetical protein